MTGRGRLAVRAAVATLASACALLPLVDPATWILRAALLVAAQTGVGVAARRVPLARPATLAAQLVVSLLLFTVFFARSEAIGGVIPGPEAFSRFGELFAEGGRDVGRYTTPAPVTDGIRVILLSSVTVVALLVDALAVTYRSAAPAGLPLLALYSVAAGLSEGGAHWMWFLSAAGGYLLLLSAEGRERLSGWGRVLTDRPGLHGRQGGAALAPVRTGRRIGALTLGIALTVPAVMPSFSGGLLDSLGTRGGHDPDGPISAVNPLVALQDSLNQPENRTVLTYETDSEAAEEVYLRIVALDRFEDAAWRPAQRPVVDVPDQLPPPPTLDPRVRTERMTTAISTADWYAQNWLPMPYPASRVDVEGDWRFEPKGRTIVGDSGQTTQGLRYTVESLVVQPTAEQLANAGRPAPWIIQEYTDVPESLPTFVREEAVRITRGAANDYERAVALQEWFTHEGGFTYDTHVQAGTGSEAIVNFLRQKEGFCVHFAFSMAAMSRTLGIPARVAVGFTPGTERSDGRMTVGLQDAHAWPELYFEGVGWTRFEPTPTRGSTPAYALPEAPEAEDGEDHGLPPREGASEEPTSAPSTSPRCTASPPEAEGDPDCEQGAVPASGDHPRNGFPWSRAGLAGAGVILLAGLALLPLMWRTRVRVRRLGPRGGTMDAWRELLDSGWDHGIPPDDSLTPRAAAARLSRQGDLGQEAAQATHRLALAIEQVLYAPAPRPEMGGVTHDVQRVRQALGAASNRRQRLRAVLLPRSAVRVVWAVAARSSVAAHTSRRLLLRPRTPR